VEYISKEAAKEKFASFGLEGAVLDGDTISWPLGYSDYEGMSAHEIRALFEGNGFVVKK
jgi:hypothetical protein